MKIAPILTQLKRFIETIESASNDVVIEEQSADLFERFLSDKDFHEEFSQHVNMSLEGVKSMSNLTIDEDQSLTFMLFSASLSWLKTDREGGNPPLAGGFSFNDGETMILERSEVLKNWYANFLEYEAPNPEEEALLAQLRWFESPYPQVSSIRVPFLGCVLPNGKTFPHDFYFFDGGIVYPLPFKTYTAYIQALIDNAGLIGWQYFYVDPGLLIKRNKGLNYMTTDFRKGTRLVENLPLYQYNPSYTFDRLDLIHEYLKRSHRFLPGAFPTLNFDHQKTWLENLEKLL